MKNIFQKRIHALSRQATASSLTKMKRGIEKESLRVNPEGRLAQTPHPIGLGSSLTHPLITTDYAESLLEFITLPFDTVEDTLSQLENIHSYVYKNLDKEILWVNSMPCIVEGNDSIPIAQYGTSNIGQLKTLYRKGLDYRYGRLMQTIAGIHYNLSFPKEFFSIYKTLRDKENPAGTKSDLQNFISENYFNLIRNFQIYCPLLVYLFGASPAVCTSFLKNRNHELEQFDSGHTYFKPYATSLRMSDLGYQNDAQSGLHICYNSIEEYIASMNHAIRTPYPEYEKIGRSKDGHPIQLSTSILQIENEYYGSIRPKPIPTAGERPTISLARSGVEYIEMRCIDLNPFEPLGINESQILFMDSFALFCLLDPAPLFSKDDYTIINNNLEKVVIEGRNPNIELKTFLHDGEDKMKFNNWANEILGKISQAASLLDLAHGTERYKQSVKTQLEKVLSPEKTPSAMVLKSLEDNHSNFFEFAMSSALNTANVFRSHKLDIEEELYFKRLAQESLNQQAELEKTNSIDFNQYVNDYLAL